MEGQVRAGLLSTIVSQIALVVVLLLSSDDLPFSFSHRHHHRSSSIFSLFLHLLTSSEVAASVSLLSDSPPPRKRRRLDFDDGGDDDQDHGERISTTIPSSGLPESSTYKACFRMRPSTFEWLSGTLEPLLDCRDPVGAGLNLSPGTRLGVALFRLATGSTYADVSRRFGVAETAARFCTKQLCRVLCTNFRFWAAFPPSAQLESVIAGFHARSGLPNCSGAVDCTRFSVLRPPCDSSEEADSVVAQIVVDSSSRILSIATGFSGDKGDARVLRSSTLYKDVEEGVLLNSPTIFLKSVTVRPYIVGDGGYPLLPWLMVPYIDPAPASCEEHFNELHYRMRLPALRTIASLRNWGILSRPIDEEMRMSVACIGACAILHNVLLMREDYSALSDGVEDYAIHDQSSQYYRDASLEECLIEKKASIVRNALAAKAREANAGH
ncbi:protein ALP1-like [Nymphaea colorata]|uniref:DDE Tnp4 domain-containing protein n=1 Tax=Nymphaea colorata TaxID=210225 RepID=A0A5K1BVC6_9MAGN|nr:protein ALP1-like [Nymphaea colorata]